MEALGADLVILPIMDPHESLQNPDVCSVRAPVRYLQRSFRRDILSMIRSHGRLLLNHPSRYLKSVGHLLRGSRSWASLRAFVQAGHLGDLALRNRIEHLHAHFAHNPASLARYASLMTGIPYSFTAHAKDLYLSRTNSLVNKAELASFITTCTGYNQRYLQKILPAELHTKVHLVYHGVDTHRFVPASRQSPDLPRILSVGRLVPKKGFRYLIEASRLLREWGIPFHLDIYGGGELHRILRQQIIEAGLSGNVTLHPACTQDELIDRYHQADLFALSPVVMENGDRDGIPNVLLEAMGCGLPVVSTDISGIPELIAHGHNGLLVPAGDAAALAHALAGLLLSATERERLGAEARESIVRRFDARASRTSRRNRSARLVRSRSSRS